MLNIKIVHTCAINFQKILETNTSTDHIKTSYFHICTLVTYFTCYILLHSTLEILKQIVQWLHNYVHFL